jgi:hypothetical protein
MIPRAPLYVTLALAACSYLLAADYRGWSPLQPFTPKPSAVRGAPLRHK